MAIQQSINNMLGTIGTVSTLGQHLAEQKKANENTEIQKNLQIKDLEYANEKDNIVLAQKKLDMYGELREKDPNELVDSQGNPITDPMEYKKKQIQDLTEDTFKLKGKRRQAAIEARNALQDELFTYADLKFDIDKRTEQIGILKGGKQ